MESYLEKFLEKLKKEGKVHTFSQEETSEIDRQINEKMEECDREFKYKNAKSIEDAKRTYITF